MTRKIRIALVATVAIVVGLLGALASGVFDGMLQTALGPRTGTPGSTDIAAIPVTVDPSGEVAAENVIPVFDIVRVEPTGDAVIAGQGAPNSAVEILSGGGVIATGKANATGEWAIVLKDPLEAGAHDITVRSTATDGSQLTSEQSVAVSVPEGGQGEVLVVLNEPGAASTILQVPGQAETDQAIADAAGAEQPTDVAAALVTPAPSTDPGATPDGAAQQLVSGQADADQVEVAAATPEAQPPAAPGGEAPTATEETMAAADGAETPAAGGSATGEAVAALDPAAAPSQIQANVQMEGQAGVPAPAATDVPAGSPTAGAGATMQAEVTPPATMPDGTMPATMPDVAIPAAPMAGAPMPDDAIPAAPMAGAPMPDVAVPAAPMAEAPVQGGVDPTAPGADAASEALLPAGGDAAPPAAGSTEPAPQTPATGVDVAAVPAGEPSSGVTTGQDTAVQDTAGQDVAGHDTAGQDTAGQDTAVQDTAGHDTAGQDTVGQDTAGQDTAGQDVAAVSPMEPAQSGQDGSDAAAAAGASTSPDPAPAPAPAEIPITIEAVELENGEQFFAAGAAQPGATVRLYVNDGLAGETTAMGTGRWLIDKQHPLAPGSHTVRVDRIAPDGSVIARAEVPFEIVEELQAALIGASGSGTLGAGSGIAGEARVGDAQTLIIRRGDNLWRIARRLYGRGTRYSTIYEANTDQIVNPDLIFPGQVFIIPESDRNWAVEGLTAAPAPGAATTTVE